MLILAINTSTKFGSVALYDSNSGLVSEINLNINLKYSETLMKMINELFTYTAYSIKDIDGVSVSLGPGSFTGIRIGVATAKAIAYGLNIPTVGINELDLISNTYSLESLDYKVAMIDARKDNIYYSVYFLEDGIYKSEKYSHGNIDDILEKIEQRDAKEVLFIGDGALNHCEKIKQKIGNNAKFLLRSQNYPRASILAEMSISMFENNMTTAVELLNPFYLRKSQAEQELEMRNSKKNKYVLEGEA